jgi:hypothetical protein
MVVTTVRLSAAIRDSLRPSNLQVSWALADVIAGAAVARMSMVSRRSTVRFRKGAPFHGAFSILRPENLSSPWGLWGTMRKRGGGRGVSLFGEGQALRLAKPAIRGLPIPSAVPFGGSTPAPTPAAWLAPANHDRSPPRPASCRPVRCAQRRGQQPPSQQRAVEPGDVIDGGDLRPGGPGDCRLVTSMRP